MLNGKTSEYSKYDSMSTEALNDILRQDADHLTDSPWDIDEILYITRLVVKREEEASTGSFPDVDPAQLWASLKEKHIDTGDFTLRQEIEADLTPLSSVPRPPKRRRILRTALIAAVLAVLFVGTAQAFPMLDWLADWTQSLFSFTQTYTTETSLPVLPPENAHFDSLEEALEACHAPDDLIPRRLQQEFEVEEFKYFIGKDTYAIFTCLYTGGKQEIRLQYILYMERRYSGEFSKDELSPDIYRAAGRDHYIMTNVGDFRVVWQNETFECSLSGFESRAELIQTIDSIYY